MYDPPGPGWYGCSLTLYYPPSSSCPSTSSVRGYFTAQDCGWPNSCNYYGSACVVTKTFDGVEGCTQGQPGCTRVEDITNLPPATVSGSFSCATPGANGWCIGGGALDLSASEPLTGYVITLIENDTGTLCDPPDAANVACTWDQGTDGSYTVEFWAHSSYGDTSAKGSAVWRQDTAGPVSTFTDPLEGSTTPASGVVNLSGTSVDAISGVAGAEIWVEGGGGWPPLEVVDDGWGATWDTTTVPDGTYFVQVRAVDLAGNVGDPGEVFLEVDNQGPVVEPAPRSTDPTHPHAIGEVQLSGGTDTYTYDASGSQTQRSEGGVTYNQTVDGAGQLITVQNTTSGETWTFVYDGDGNRIRQINPDGTSTLFLAGGLYEVTLNAGGQQTAAKRYYAVAGQTIALRDAAGTFYMLTDHLGSVVAVLDGSGAVVGEQRYRPFGQPRLTPGITQSDLGFTGQQSLAAGLVDFNARWVDASLGMFSSPDSLIPAAYNPQALNRYGYVLNNPLRYTDPTGQWRCEYGLESCSGAPAPVALEGTTVYGLGATSTQLTRTAESRNGASTSSADPSGTSPAAPQDTLAQADALFQNTVLNPVSWNDLAVTQQHLLMSAGWDQRSFDIEVTGTSAVSVDGTLAGPAVWVIGTFGVGKVAPVVVKSVSALLNLGVAQTALQVACADGDCLNEIRTGTTTVYQGITAIGGRYMGITSDFARRMAEHARSGILIEQLPGLQYLSRADARAVDQFLIQGYGLGNLANRINSIALSNPIYSDAMMRAQDIPSAVGFPLP